MIALAEEAHAKSNGDSQKEDPGIAHEEADEDGKEDGTAVGKKKKKKSKGNRFFANKGLSLLTARRHFI